MRISGITIPEKKRLAVALTELHGIGSSRAKKILDEMNISYDERASSLSSEQEGKLREKIESYTIEGNLRREVSGNVKRLKDIGSYRGMRHMRNLPARGQRTKTNSRTVRGNVRKTMGSGKRKVEKK